MTQPAKRNPGRPRLAANERRQTIKLSLPTEVIRRMGVLGSGNRSLGVERAVNEKWTDECREQPEKG